MLLEGLRDDAARFETLVEPRMLWVACVLLGLSLRDIGLKSRPQAFNLQGFSKSSISDKNSVLSGLNPGSNPAWQKVLRGSTTKKATA
ncbi:hypothetical protein ACUUL3_07010 [Thiovibrio sp. JS02]